MRNLFAETPSEPQPVGTDPVPLGRTFVIGNPSVRRAQSIFLGGRLWQLAPGDYQAGDRVEVIDCDAENRLIVRVVKA